MSARCRIVCLFSTALLFAGVSRAEDTKLERRVYQVADLVLPVRAKPKKEQAASTALQTTSWAASRERNADVPVLPPPAASPTANLVTKEMRARMSEARLAKLITRTIAPHSWSRRGGRGTIDYFPLSKSLVINQTPQVQDQIADLLAAQRRLQDMEVAVEVKFAVVADEVFQNLKRGGVFGNPAEQGVVFLKDPQVFLLMEVLQSDVRSNVMQAPKLTMFNRQTAHVNAIDKQFFVTGVEVVQRAEKVEYQQKIEVVPLGLQMSLRPIVSADRRLVRLHLDATMSNLDSTEVPLRRITTRIEPSKNAGPDVEPVVFTQYIQQPRVTKLHIDRTLLIPDGSTAVLTGWEEQCDVSKNIGPEFLGAIPYLGQLFRKVESETYHHLVLVTPRILIDLEQEKKPRTLPPLNKQ